MPVLFTCLQNRYTGYDEEGLKKSVRIDTGMRICVSYIDTVH